MRRLQAVGLGLGGVAAACAGVVPAMAQAPPAPRPTVPPLSGPGSLDGIWNNVAFSDVRTGPPLGAAPGLKTADGEPIPLQPWAAKLAAERRTGFENGAPFANNNSKCLTEGMPNAISTPAELPLQIIETPGQVTVLYEFFSTFRIIHMNEKHPDDPDPTFMGNAVGHWEGGALVVDTIAITDKTHIMNLLPHSEDLHVVERIGRTGPDTLEDVATIDDPKTFTKPWTMVARFKRVPGMRLQEYVCENNRNNADENGHTGIQLSTPAAPGSPP